MPPKVLKKSKNDAGKQKQVAGETTTKPAEQKTASSTSKETQQTGGAAAAKQKPEKKPEKKEEMDAERELSEDAVWKRIQQNTFTRWVNEHLKSANKSIGSLETDLSDGLRLIALIEVLSAKRLSKHNKKPTFRSQKLENCAVSMKFLMEDEGIKIVNIDSSDIVDCKLKLILGLIWTLILHYSISMPMWEGEEEMEKGKSKKTPKQRLLNWVQSKVTEMPISNFTSDWNNGKAIGALVDAVAPGLCPDWENWDPKNALKNAQEAMEMANKWLDIPELIEPSELVNPKLDEMSMMTYLSQFPNAKLKPGAPVRPPTNPKKVRAYGPGIEPNPIPAGCPTNFTIETFSAGQGNVVVEVENPNKQKEPVDTVYNDDKAKTYTCTYVPKLQGPHRVKVNFAGKPIPKSPFDVKVEGIAGDPKKVTCSGPGIEPAGVVAGKPTYFDVSTRDAGLGVIEATVVDPKKPDITVPCKTTKVDDHNYKCEYIAPTPGMHAVNVSFAGRPAAKSPYNVNVSPAAEAKKVKASGRGLQPKGIRVGDAADFKVFTAGAGAGNLDIKVVPPSGQPIEVERKLLDDKTTHECIYRPTSEGRHVVLVSYGGQEISKSPFEVNVGPQKESKIRAFGPGLSGGVVDQPACFTVETNGETGALGFSIEGPSQTKIDCHDNGDGTCDVKYYPKVPGDYAVHILCDNEDIPRSPYMANIVTQLANVNPDKVEAYGPGIQKDGVTIGKPTEFTVDTKKAGGPAPLHVSVMDNEYKPVDVQVKDNKDGTFKCTYKPERPVKHTVQVNYANVTIPNSPYRVNVSVPADKSKVKVFGPGVEKGLISKKRTHFTVDCKEAGKGNVEVAVLSDRGDELPFTIQDNLDSTFTVEYTPPAPGNYKVKTSFDGKEIPKSPIDVKVDSDIDISKIKIEGLEPSVFKDSWTDFLVDARAVTKNGDKKVTCTITNPSGAKTNSVIQNMNDGTYKVCYTPFEEGPHTIQITYDGVPVPGSPFKVNVTKGCDPSKCKAYGPGLERGITNQKNTFTIETKGAGVGGLGLAVEGPSDARIKCVDNKDGSCTVEYNPTEAGDYEIGVKFADQNIPGSPFKVPVDAPVDSSKVTAHGPGLDPNHCRANVPQKFTVDARQSGKAPVDVQVLSDAGPIQEKPVVKDLYDGTYEVSYKTPPEGSKCDVKVTHGGKDIPKSPFQMKVKPKSEPKNVKVSGPGVSSKGVPASLPTDVIIDTKTAGYSDLEVVVVGPDGEPKKTKLTNNGDGTHKATYVPDDVGKYQVKVKYDGQEVPNSPFNVNANPIGNADKCKITEGKQESVTIGEEYCITVNAQQAGQGALTCRIRSSSVSSAPGGGPGVPPSQKAKPKDRQNGAPGDIDISIEDNGDGTFSVYYKVKEPGDYSISLKFGGQNVPNGSYKVKATERVVKEEEITIVETQRITQQTTQHTLQSVSGVPKEFQPVELNNIPIPGTGGKPTAQVKMPSGNIDEPQIIDNGDGTISVKFDPREEGQHEMVVKYNHEHVEGSPFSFFVDKQKCGYITAYGSGLTHGVCGEPCKFIVSTKNAGAGGLSMAIEGPSKAEINCKDNKDGTINVSYLPTSPGEYKLTVKFGGKNIRGSPFTPKITGEGRKRNQISVGHSSEVSLKVTEKDIKNLHASIIAPSGLEEPCFVKKLPNGHLGISFTPREKGEHSVNVKRMGDHINKSPFKIQVGEREIGDASKVKVSGKSLKEGKTQTNNEFTVNTEHAGYGGLSLSIEGPSKADIQCKDNENGTLNVNYKPTEPGYYIINLKFADHHVIGSPFTVKVTGAGSGSKTERIKRDREAAPVTEVGHECKFTVRLPGTNPFDMTSRVTSPNGKTDDAEIIDMEDSTYAVHFVPKELGVHTISIRHKDIHIPGSPFQFTVGPLKEGGAHKVHAGGPGLERGEITKSCEFNVWTREAGAGHLAISVEGPSKAEIDFKDRKDGSCYVMYTVPEQGEYRVGIKFNDQHIPDSPYKVYITPGMGESNKLVLGSLPDNNLEVDKPVSFIIQMNGAHGSPDGKVISPSGKEDDCFVTPVDEDQWACRFIPRENGVHQIQVKLAGLHIPESPFRLRVGKDEADPAALHAYGNGLTHIKTGQKTDFIVDTCNAGSGTLVVTIEGPSKVAMDCTEVAEGYKVRYTPLAPGEYFITVKYNTYHIAGSPFRVPCSGKAVAEIGTQEASTVIVETVSKEAKHKTTNTALPKFKSNASKVTCKGLGLKRAHLNKQNQFNVNCADAGNNMLYVSIHGPKLPVDEVFVKHHGNHTFNVNYMLKERGDHYIVIKYGEEDIPGSPFKIDVV